MVGAETMEKVSGVGRTADFDTFYRQERTALYRAVALAVGNADVAAEAVDEGMVRAYQNWWRISGYDNPSGWVYRVAVNWAVSRLRRGRVPEMPAATAHVDGEPETDTSIGDAIAGLPLKLRSVVVLRFHLDWSIEQIATALRIPTGTVKSRLHRGLAQLRRDLEEANRES